MEFEIYLTNLYRYVKGDLIGKWIALPISPSALTNIEEDILSYGGEELFISDSTFPIDEYDNYREYNELFGYAEEKNKLKELEIIMKAEPSYNPTELHEIIENENFEIIDGEDYEALGLYLVENDRVPNSEYIKEINPFYIDFFAIGKDYHNNADCLVLGNQYILF